MSMDINRTLKEILSKELEIDNSLLNEKKLLISLFKESLQGTSEKDDIPTKVVCHQAFLLQSVVFEQLKVNLV